MSVEVYRQWRGGLSTRRPPRLWSYLQQRRQASDPSTRHDPATAVPEETRWYDFIDGPISLLLVPLVLVLAGLGRMVCHYLLVAVWMVVDRRAVIVVARDGQVIERHQVAGRLAGVRLARLLIGILSESIGLTAAIALGAAAYGLSLVALLGLLETCGRQLVAD